MRKTVYRLKKFRLSEISLVDRPACDIATLERIELVKRDRSLEPQRQSDQIFAQEKSLMTTEELNALPDSAFAYIEPGGTKDSGGRTLPRSLRHFPIHDAAHVRNALARVNESKFGPEALPAILEAAKKFGIHTELDSSQPTAKFDNACSFAKSDRATVDPNVGFLADTATSHYPAGNFIAGNPSEYAGSAGLIGDALAIEDLPLAFSPGEIRKYVPSGAMPILDDSTLRADSTSLSKALNRCASDASLGEICDLLVLTAANVLRTPTIENKKAALLAIGDDFKTALTNLLAEPDFAKRVGATRWRERAIGIEQAMRTASRKQALVSALRKLNFSWPDGVPAIRVLGENDRALGSLLRADFEKRGAMLSAANRDRLHQARDILIGMCAASGCPEDRGLKSSLDALDGDSSAAPGETPITGASDTAAPAGELGKLLDNLRRATGTLGALADEVRKVAETSSSSIRKSEGSAKVLSALSERIARLEAQPDNSRLQPLRAVEKGTPIALMGPGTDDARIRIADLQSQAAELRKRGDDPAAQKRLSEIGVEIIRLSSATSRPAL